MRRILVTLVLLLAAAIALPPLWFRLSPVATPELPPAGRSVALPGGVAVNLVESGAGPAVVLVHGLPGSAYEWRELAPPLAARGRRVLAYDRVGFGRSDPRPDARYSVEQNAAELLALLEALALDDAVIVGWSYGGATAMAAARRDPSRVAGLVLVGSAGPGMEGRGPPPIFRYLYSDPVIAWLRMVPPVARAMQASVSRVAFSEQPAPDWWLPGLAANFAQPHTSRSWREEGMRFVADPIPDTAGLALPVLVIHGSDDRLAPVAIGRELHRRASDARLVVVEGGSHMLPVTHAELLAGEIAGFAAVPTL